MQKYVNAPLHGYKLKLVSCESSINTSVAVLQEQKGVGHFVHVSSGSNGLLS